MLQRSAGAEGKCNDNNHPEFQRSGHASCHCVGRFGAVFVRDPGAR